MDKIFFIYSLMKFLNDDCSPVLAQSFWHKIQNVKTLKYTELPLRHYNLNWILNHLYPINWDGLTSIYYKYLPIIHINSSSLVEVFPNTWLPRCYNWSLKSLLKTGSLRKTISSTSVQQPQLSARNHFLLLPFQRFTRLHTAHLLTFSILFSCLGGSCPLLSVLLASLERSQ